MEQIITDKGLVGWRGFHFLKPHFLSTMGLLIQPRVRPEAECINDETHAGPIEGCSCGFYSFKNFGDLCAQGYFGQEIIAEVWVWGKVIEHEAGYKSQYYYPKKIYTNNPRIKPYLEYIANLYGCEWQIGINPVHKPSTPSPARQRPLTFEDLWEMAFDREDAPKELRRFARQQARQRVYMKLRGKQARIDGLQRAYHYEVRKKADLENQMRLLDQLKEKLNP